MQMDTLIRGGRLVDVATRSVHVGWDIAIAGGRIVCLGPDLAPVAPAGVHIVEAGGAYVVPGLLSAHDHYEMTLMSAVPFAEAVLPYGTTTVVMDPHDMVNVAGIEGMRALAAEARLAPLRVHWMVPPCVPSSPGLEDAGYNVTLADVRAGMQIPGALGVAEAMDFQRILARDPAMMEILAWAAEQHLRVDGHCPGLVGPELCAYIAAGPIRSDHESLDVEEQLEKLARGMYVILRRGSLTEPMSAADLVDRVADTSQLLLGVDGCINVEDLLQHGHMSWAVRQIIAEGVDPLVAIQMATLNVARCYGLETQVGVLAPGRYADLLLVDGLETFGVRQAFVGGQPLPAEPSYPRYAYPAELLDTVQRAPLSAEDLAISAPASASETVRVRAMHVAEGSLATGEVLATLPVRDGRVCALPAQGLLKVAVLNRYGLASKAVGFIQGFGLHAGALAGSVGQDAQNLVVVGADDADMALATNRVRELGGGVVVAAGGRVVSELPLPIAGIMTDVAPKALAAGRQALKQALCELGCGLADPIFTLSLAITLVVIPQLKLSNRGLVDVNRGVFVDLFV